MVGFGARHGHPGARRGADADPLRQALRRRRHPGRPRHQGRPDRRPARGRAHGRRGAVVRGRRLAPVPHPARGQEPLRPDRRDRRVRDDRRRACSEVANPSELFLSERDLGSPGTAVFAGIEGSRPLLVEIQALVAPTSLGTPRRAVVGWDQSRLSMVLAVLEAHCGVKLSGHDVYLNVAGGLAHPGAGRRSRRRRRAGVVARQCAAAGRRGVLRRGLAVGRGAAGGADRGAAQGGAEARLRPRRHAGGVARRRRRSADARNRRLARRPSSPTSPRAATARPGPNAAPRTRNKTRVIDVRNVSARNHFPRRQQFTYPQTHPAYPQRDAR